MAVASSESSRFVRQFMESPLGPPLSMPRFRTELDAFLRHPSVSLDPLALHVMSYQEYQQLLPSEADYADRAPASRVSSADWDIPVADARVLRAEITNVTVQIDLMTRDGSSSSGEEAPREFSVPLERLHSQLISRGYFSLFNQKKLSNCLQRLSPPFGCYMSIFRRGRIECKGTLTIFAAFMSIEWMLARISETLMTESDQRRQSPSSPFVCAPPQITNIGSRCAFPFEFDACDLRYRYPDKTENPANFMNVCITIPGLQQTDPREIIRLSTSGRTTMTMAGARSIDSVAHAYRVAYDMVKDAASNRAPLHFREQYLRERQQRSISALKEKEAVMRNATSGKKKRAGSGGTRGAPALSSASARQLLAVSDKRSISSNGQDNKRRKLQESSPGPAD